MEKKTSKTFTCCICQKKSTGFGNNPDPLAGKKCCNARYVIPVRLYMLYLQSQ